MSDSASLDHVLIVGGHLDEWLAMGDDQWLSHIGLLTQAFNGVGAQWLSVYPFAGHLRVEQSSNLLNRLSVLAKGTVENDRVIAGLSPKLIFDVCADGQDRFVRAVNELDPNQLSETIIDQAVLAPAEVEPDLIVVFGKPTQLPPSLMWELAYSELVFLDMHWTKCNIDDVQLAVNDFQRRDRRFGGVDS